MRKSSHGFWFWGNGARSPLLRFIWAHFFLLTHHSSLTLLSQLPHSKHTYILGYVSMFPARSPIPLRLLSGQAIHTPSLDFHHARGYTISITMKKTLMRLVLVRSEERRVGKEGRSRGS